MLTKRTSTIIYSVYVQISQLFHIPLNSYQWYPYPLIYLKRFQVEPAHVGCYREDIQGSFQSQFP